VAWYDDNSHGETHPAALKRPNALGLYDMSGNVWEWCQDRYDGNYFQDLKDRYGDRPAPDPPGPETGDGRVVRGGSWFNANYYARVAFRYYDFPNYRSNYGGFRLCRYRVM
jgi:formylglycine-generating enzyme